MRIFNYNPAVTDLDKYYNQIENSKEISGILINVEINKDATVDVYMPYSGMKIPVQEFLEKFKPSKKIIIFNTFLKDQELSVKSSLQVANYNNEFISKIEAILEGYPNKFYILTTNTSILYFLKIKALPYKIGTLVTSQDLGFIDVDFYVFNEYFANTKFIESLLKNKKEVMIIPDTTDFIKELPNNIKKELDYIVQSMSFDVNSE